MFRSREGRKLLDERGRGENSLGTVFRDPRRRPDEKGLIQEQSAVRKRTDKKWVGGGENKFWQADGSLT